MNVLFVIDPNIVGGATKSFIELVTILKEKYGINMFVLTGGYTELNIELRKNRILTFADGHVSAMQVRENNIKGSKFKRCINRFFEEKQYIRMTDDVISRIEKKINLKKIDLIHTNSARNDIGCILSKKYNIPHIMHIREFGVEDFGCIFLRKNYYSFINDGTDGFIAVSNAVRKSWIKKGIDAKKICVIYNGINNTDISCAIKMTYFILKR